MQQIAIVTGASSGIGYALSIELATRGICVVAIARNEDALTKLQQQCSDKIQVIAADITCASGREAIINKINNLKINYLVNCAGIIAPLGPLNEASDDELRNIMETNILAPMFLTKSLIPFFCLSGEKRILNITSVSGKLALMGAGGYCISKAALNMWTSMLQIELAEFGITAASVIPGEVDTGMQQALRDAPIEQFPLATEFQQSKASGTLISAKICGHFLAGILLDSTREEFSKKEWNIYTDYKANPIPAPFNKDKLAVDFNCSF